MISVIFVVVEMERLFCVEFESANWKLKLNLGINWIEKNEQVSDIYW